MKEKIQELERQIAALPIGYISKKTINGKTRYYHQWTENGKKHSQYLRDGELEPLQEQIEQRKVLQAQLKELQAKMPKVRQPKLDFETSVIVGKGLAAMSQGVKGWGLRDCFGQLEDYLYSNESDRVCLVFGLRRTGKTTMLRQAIARMSKEDLSRTAYIKARRSDTMAMMNRDLKKLFDAGFRYVFIDEVTLMRDFIDSAALFSDVFAAMGMKIILSGTDSLGFWLAMDQDVYKRQAVKCPGPLYSCRNMAAGIGRGCRNASPAIFLPGISPGATAIWFPPVRVPKPIRRPMACGRTTKRIST